MKSSPSQATEKSKRKAQRVFSLLQDFYGLPEWRQPLEALDELVSTILSQNTSDTNRDQAFLGLKQKYENWEAVRDAPLEDVVEAIRPAGLANRKAPRIQAILKQISRERGTLSLEFLKTLPPDEVRTWLTGFNGVGPKTAAIVMQFALGMPAFPVDTHVQRVCGRLGLRPEGMGADAVHAWMEALFMPQQYGPGHLNLIRLGREICVARKPRCEVCPLNKECDYFQHRMDQAGH